MEFRSQFNLFFHLLSIICSALVLQGCGGDSPSSPTTTTTQTTTLTTIPWVLPDGTKLALKWMSNVSVYHGELTETREGTGYFYYDRRGQRWRSTVEEKGSIFSTGISRHIDKNWQAGPNNQNTTIYTGGGAGVCTKTIGAAYTDPFATLAWHSILVKNGAMTIGGVQCTVWQTEPVEGIIGFSSCVGDDGIVRALNDSNFMSNMVFTDVSIPTDSEFDDFLKPSDACLTVPAACRGVPSPEKLKTYHSSSSILGDGMDGIADAQGMAAWLCVDGANVPDKVSSIVMSVDTAYMPYDYCWIQRGCNSVGRSSTFALGSGTLDGQCTNNTDVGSVYTLPHRGECKKGADIGVDGCTWVVQVNRTIDTKCLMEDRGLAKQCGKEYGSFPWTSSIAILEKALAADDPKQGGCPDVGISSMVV